MHVFGDLHKAAETGRENTDPPLAAYISDQPAAKMEVHQHYNNPTDEESRNKRFNITIQRAHSYS